LLHNMARTIVLFDEIFLKLKPLVWAVAAVSFFINLLILPLSLYSLQIMDRVVNTGSVATLVWLTVIMGVMFAVAGVLQSLRSMILARGAEWAHDGIADLALPLVLAQAAGGIKGAQQLRDAAQLRSFLSGSGLVTLLDSPWAVLYIAALFVIHTGLGFLVTGGACMLLALAWFNELSIRDAIKEAGARHTRSLQELDLATRNAEVTEAMGMGKALVVRWKHIQKRTAELQRHGSNRASVIQGFTKFVRLTLQVMVTGTAAWLAIQGDVTIGAIVASSILSSRALAPFEAAISSWKSLAETQNAFMRLRHGFRDASEREEAMPLPAPDGVVVAEELEYTAPHQDRPILQNINFRLEAGEMLGIIGPSGSGKSTLARLLMGVMAPSAGAARLDGADIYRWPRESFGQYVGYLPQDVELFGGNIRENIGRFREQSPESIVKAAQLANAHELILRLSHGYDTQIGAGGALLSAGQRQRIGLARALYGDPRFLVLDEPDASLDEAGQQSLMMVLRRAKFEGRTTIMVTHRKSLLSHCDKLLLLRDGTVAAFGLATWVMEQLGAHQAVKRSEEAAGT
jgi:ATP-binding cassette subfamily B protein